MPYIEQKDRMQYSHGIDMIAERLRENNFEPGHVNYVFSEIIGAWFRHEKRYVTICKIMGTLQSVASEFYRRKGAPYEDVAIDKNIINPC